MRIAVPAAVVTAILMVSALAGLIVLHNQVAQLRSQVTRQETATAQQIRQLDSAEMNTATQLAGLTQPADPLAAYDQICNAQLQNGSTGVTQTYYYPCTNNAQTIPQPGN